MFHVASSAKLCLTRKIGSVRVFRSPRQGGDGHRRHRGLLPEALRAKPRARAHSRARSFIATKENPESSPICSADRLVANENISRPSGYDADKPNWQSNHVRRRSSSRTRKVQKDDLSLSGRGRHHVDLV